MFDEPCRLTFIFLNVLYPQYRFGIALILGGKEAADSDCAIFPMLPYQSVLTDDFSLDFQAHCTREVVFSLHGLVFEHQIQYRYTRRRITQYTAFGDAGGKG